MARFHRYEGFAEQLRQAILQIIPNNLTALIVGANQAVFQTRGELQKACNPKSGDLAKYPQAHQACIKMQAMLEHVDGKSCQEPTLARLGIKGTSHSEGLQLNVLMGQ